MLAIHPPTLSANNSSPPVPKHLTPNILPCTIHHNGALKISKRYWNPTTTTTTTSSSSSGLPNHDTSSSTRTAYFRGRKLQGRILNLPNGYQGYLLQKTERKLVEPGSLPAAKNSDEDGEEEGVGEGRDEEEEVETTLLEQRGTFDKLVVWGHEVVPGDGDEYVKGVGEWMGFAEAVSGGPIELVEGDGVLMK